MKKLFQFSALLCLLLFVWGCKKDSLTDQSLPQAATERDAGRPGEEPKASLTDASSLEGEEFIPCSELNADQNFFQIKFCLQGGGISPVLCYTEAELKAVLLNAGVSQAQANDYMNRLFHSAESSRPDLAFEIGGFIPSGATIPPGSIPTCYEAFAGAFGPFNVPTVVYPPGGPVPAYTGCPPGPITRFRVRQARANSGVIIGTVHAFRLRLRNTCTNQVINIPLNNQNVKDAMLASGMTSAQADNTLIQIGLGTLSARQFWNLFQLKIGLYLAYQAGVTGDEIAYCVEMTEVAFLVLLETNGSPSHITAYNMMGKGDLYCGPLP